MSESESDCGSLTLTEHQAKRQCGDGQILMGEFEAKVLAKSFVIQTSAAHLIKVAVWKMRMRTSLEHH
jgi:hypothetical protein